MARIQYLTNIDFDFGCIESLDSALAECGIRRPLVVTDPGIVEVGLLDRLRAATQHQLIVFDRTPPNPTEQALQLALERYIEIEADGLIAFGGGSSIDLAKGIALMATHPAPLQQYAVASGGDSLITSEVSPVIAIPTTAGTGSEVGRAALLTLNDTRKLGFVSPHLIPRRAICDPGLTLGLPPGLTAATGMDAFTHCVETYLSPRINPPADAIALDGLSRCYRWITTAVTQGDNREARWQMMMAALQGGLTFQKGLGAVHAMSHPLGGLSEINLHHGTLNAVLLPDVLRFNESHAIEKYQHIRQLLGVPESTDLARLVEELNTRLGLPASLKEMGLLTEVLPRMAEAAALDHCTATNPRPINSNDYLALLNAQMGTQQ